MADVFGASFSPTDQENGDRRPRNVNGDRSLQVLNLRLPRFQGARGISPLIGGSPRIGGVAPINSVLASLIQMILGGQTTGGFGPTPGTFGASSMGQGMGQPGLPPVVAGYHDPGPVLPTMRTGPPRVSFPFPSRPAPTPVPGAGPRQEGVRRPIVSRTGRPDRDVGPPLRTGMGGGGTVSSPPRQDTPMDMGSMVSNVSQAMGVQPSGGNMIDVLRNSILGIR